MAGEKTGAFLYCMVCVEVRRKEKEGEKEKNGKSGYDAQPDKYTFFDFQIIKMD